MVDRRKTPTHKRIRDACSSKLFKSVTTTDTEQKCSLPGRQLDRGVLHKQARRNEISLTLPTCLGTTSLGQNEQCSNKSPTYCRKTERAGRQTEQTIPSHRMEFESERFQSNIENLSKSSSNNRSVCDQVEPSITPILQSCVRPSGSGSRCPLSVVGKPGSVCVSPISADSISSQKDTSRTVCSDSNSPVLAEENLVLNDIRTTDRTSPGDSTSPKPSTSRTTDSCQTRDIQISCMDAFEQVRSKKGFSSKASKYAHKCVRTSSSEVYSAKWKIFSDWCNSTEIDPLQVSSAQLADFFVYLFEERNLQPSTIKGYRSALLFVLGDNSKLSSESMFSAMMKGFESLKSPKTQPSLPKWDLPLVLQYLESAEFSNLSLR